MLKSLQLFTFLLFAAFCSKAQMINGSVKNEGDTLLSGVTVKLLDLKNNLVAQEATNKEGGFSFNNLNNDAAYNLVFSMIGYAERSLKNIKANSTNNNNISIVLAQDSKVLDAVLVTALGIKRSEKALGYAAQSINTEDVNDARSNNFVNALLVKLPDFH